MLSDPCVLPHLSSLRNRIVMAAMTRGFADQDHCATEAMSAYYARRARDGVALILTEGTIVHPSGDGYNNVPYIVTDPQTRSWARVVDAVHSAGGKIFSQLWHCGRISHPDYLGGRPPVSSTDRAASGIHKENGKPFAVPRRLEEGEMAGIYRMFVDAALNAQAAGFDGVELHLAHGYLADQFFDARVNDRTDRYGGSVENRCRFGLELTEQVLRALDPKRVMIRISPSRDMGGLYDWPDLEAMLAHLIPALDEVGLRLLDVSCARADYYATSGRVIRMIRPQWPHILVGGASLSREQAETELCGWLDMVSYGRHILANPDFVTRMRAGAELVTFDRSMLGSLW
jgi:N-ethylmaleimide reductase